MALLDQTVFTILRKYHNITKSYTHTQTIKSLPLPITQRATAPAKLLLTAGRAKALSNNRAPREPYLDANCV